MKNLATILVTAAILLIVYSAVGRFIGVGSLNLGLLRIVPLSGVIAANSIMLLAIIAKLWSK